MTTYAGFARSLGLPSHGLLLQAHFTIAEVIRGRIGHVLNGAFLQFLCHDVQAVEDLLVIALLECVKLAIVRPSIRVDLGVAIGLEDAAHGPLTVDEAAVLDHQKLRSSATWAS